MFPVKIIFVLLLAISCRNYENSHKDIGVHSPQADTNQVHVHNPRSIIHDEVVKHIPEDYELLDTCRGDLNLDGYSDLLLLLKKKKEEESSDVIDHPEERPLFLFTQDASGQYTLAKKNNRSVLCVNCGGVYGDPYHSMVIKDGYFSIEHYGGSNWRWARIITYKYDSKSNDWCLYKDGTDNYHVSDPEKIESTIKTTKDFGKVSFEEFDIYNEN